MESEFFSLKPNSSSFEEIIYKIKEFAQNNYSRKKIFIGVCGIPGSGKSSFSEKLKEKLSDAIIIPLDGYHIFRKDLTEEQMKFRGRHDTFDLQRFVSHFLELYELKDCISEESFYFPSFDHSLKDPVENNIKISNEKFYIFEGLYLFLKDLDIMNLFDVKILLVSDIHNAMERVAKRNFEARITNSLEESIKRTEISDKNNAIYVLKNSDFEKEKEDIIFYSYLT